PVQGALDGVKPVAQALRDGVVLAHGRQRLRGVASVSGLAVHLGLAILLARRLGVLQQALHLVALGNEQAARAVLVHRAVLPQSLRAAACSIARPSTPPGSTRSCPTAPRIPTSRPAMSCWAGSSRGERRSSTPPRCA